MEAVIILDCLVTIHFGSADARVRSLTPMVLAASFSTLIVIDALPDIKVARWAAVTRKSCSLRATRNPLPLSRPLPPGCLVDGTWRKTTVRAIWSIGSWLSCASAAPIVITPISTVVKRLANTRIVTPLSAERQASAAVRSAVRCMGC